MKRSLNQRKETSKKHKNFGESNDDSSEPIIRTQRFQENIENMSQKVLFDDFNEDNQNGTQLPNMTSSDEWLDQLGPENMPKVKHSSNLLSQQEIVNRSDVWKGSHVVNYKKFKKLSQDDFNSQSSNSSAQSIDLVPLKMYDNPYYKNNESQNELQVEVEIEKDIDEDFIESSSRKPTISTKTVSRKSRR